MKSITYLLSTAIAVALGVTTVHAQAVGGSHGSSTAKAERLTYEMIGLAKKGELSNVPTILDGENCSTVIGAIVPDPDAPQLPEMKSGPKLASEGIVIVQGPVINLGC